MQLTDQHLHDAGTALTRVLTTIGVHPLEAQPNSAFRLISQSIALNHGPGDVQTETAALEMAARAAADLMCIIGWDSEPLNRSPFAFKKFDRLQGQVVVGNSEPHHGGSIVHLIARLRQLVVDPGDLFP